MIRLGGAEDLAASLGINSHLTYLDLSFNTLGTSGGIILGDALISNQSLKILKICNNAIDETACVTIVQGLILNHSIQHIVMDGNPIGEQGIKALMQIPFSSRLNLVTSCANCNTVIKDSKCVFIDPVAKLKDPKSYKDPRYDSSTPIGEYELHLDNPFHRAIALSLLDVVVRHKTFVIAKISHQTVATGGRPGSSHANKKSQGETIDLVATVVYDKMPRLKPHEVEEIEYLQRSLKITSELEKCVQHYNQVCKLLNVEELECEGLHQVLVRMGLHKATLTDADGIIRDYDLDGDASLGENEFRIYISVTHTLIKNQLDDMLGVPIYALKSQLNKTPLKKWIPPKTGILRVSVLDGMKSKSVYKFMSPWECKIIYDIAKTTQDVCQTIENGVKLLKLRLAEAVVLFDRMYKEKTMTKVKLLASLLPTLHSHLECRKLISICTEDDKIDFQNLKKYMGNALRIMLGTYDGYYCLDLVNESDRICLYRLIEISKNINQQRKANCPLKLGLVGVRIIWC